MLLLNLFCRVFVFSAFLSMAQKEPKALEKYKFQVTQNIRRRQNDVDLKAQKPYEENRASEPLVIQISCCLSCLVKIMGKAVE